MHQLEEVDHFIERTWAALLSVDALMCNSSDSDVWDGVDDDDEEDPNIGGEKTKKKEKDENGREVGKRVKGRSILKLKLLKKSLESKDRSKFGINSKMI